MQIILISVDSLRGDFFDLCGTFGIELKTLSALRKVSIFFPNTFVQTSYTLPSHATMFTGLYPFNHGLRGHRGFKLKKGITTLLDILKEKKIHTALFLGQEIISEQLGYKNINLVGKPSLPRIDNKISEWRDKDFFIFIHYWGTHIPYLPPPFTSVNNLAFNLLTVMQLRGYLSDYLYQNLMFRTSIKGVHILRSNLWQNRINYVRKKMLFGEVEKVKQSYVRSILLFDKFLTGIIERLKSRGIFNEVRIILTGDHGECFNEHGEFSSEQIEYMHGHFLFNNVLRVPTFLKLKNDRKLCAATLIQTVDIFPTILDLFEINAEGREMDGVSLLKSNQKNMPTVYFETLLGDTRKAGIIFDNLKIIRDLKTGRDYVFDLIKDSLEMNNLVEKSKEQRYNITKKFEEFVLKNNISFEKKTGDDEITEEDKEFQDRLRALGYIG